MTRTVLILGAGASKDYGFPLGSELLVAVRDLVGAAGAGVQASKLSFPASVFRQLVVEALDGVHPEARSRSVMLMRQMSQLIAGQLPTSIDWFLGQEFKDEYVPFREIGLLAITWQIAFAEKHKSLDKEHGTPSCYRTLWQSLAVRQVSDFERMVSGDLLRVVTFNYDRSFEQFLLRRFEALYDAKGDPAPLEAAHNLLAKLDVCHVYGSLGDLVSLPYGAIARDWEERQDSQQTSRRLRDARSKLVVIEATRKEAESAAFNQARDWISAADRLVFLGFGFDKENLRRLGFPIIRKRAEQVFATTMGLSPTQRNTALGLLTDDWESARSAGARNIADEHAGLTVSDYLTLLQPTADLARESVR